MAFGRGGLKAKKRAGLAFSFFSHITARFQLNVRSAEAPRTMPLIQVVLLLIVVGVILWLINQYIPMAGSIKSILNAVVVIAVIIWLLNVFGILSNTGHVHIG
jgi:hypothetical protein